MTTIQTFARSGRVKSVLLGLAAAGLGLGLSAAAPAPVASRTASQAEAKAAAIKVAALAAAQSRDGYNRRVRVHNQTGWTMLRFYASDSRTSDWEEDILGADTLAAGRSLSINIDDGSGACVYDFKAEFTNGQTLTRFNINVCQIADYYYTR
jgi:Fe-S cluster assembly iron-binding protein IscA